MGVIIVSDAKALEWHEIYGRLANGRNLGDRIKKALHLYKTYPAGYEKGKVAQIIRSCKKLRCQVVSPTHVHL